MTQQYFEDMWLALESELSTYDNYDSNSNYQSSESPLGTEDPIQESQLEPQTYEDLLEVAKKAPEHSQLRSPNRKERTEAVKEFYNRTPTILNAKLKEVAESLYKKGFVRQGNSLMKIVGKTDIDQDIPILGEYDFLQELD